MPKGDPAGYLPAVKKARKSKKAAPVKPAKKGKSAGNPMRNAVPRY